MLPQLELNKFLTKYFEFLRFIALIFFLLGKETTNTIKDFFKRCMIITKRVVHF